MYIVIFGATVWYSKFRQGTEMNTQQDLTEQGATEAILIRTAQTELVVPKISKR